MAAVPRATYRPFGALRFALALMVCLFHAGYVLPASTHWFFHQLGFGMVAVMVFFVISGFVIAEALQVFYADRPGAFLRNRVLRLLPPYAAALALAALVQEILYQQGRLALWGGDLVGSPLRPRTLLAGALDIVPFFKPTYIGAQDIHFIPFSWSLRIEFAFYLVIAAALFLANRAPARRRAVLIGATLLLYAGFGVFAATGRGPRQLDAIPFFAFGIAMLQLTQRSGPGSLLHATATLAGVLVAFRLWDQAFSPVFAYQLPLLSVLLAAFVGLCFLPSPGRRAKSLDLWLGDLSYPLYLNHFIVVLAVQDSTTEYGWPAYALVVALSLLLAAVMLRLVDTPMRGLRARVRGVALSAGAVRATQAI